MTEEQNGNGRRPMFVETADHPPSQGYTIHQRRLGLQNPFDREREPVKYWLFWIGSGIVFVVLTITTLGKVLPIGFF
jgi:hypothetical protein